MSSLSQTPARPPTAFRRRFAITMAVVALGLAIALRGVLAQMVQVAATAHPHAPDLVLLGALSPVIKVHLGFAMAALALGGVLMTARKGRAFHRTAGWIWVSTVAVTAGSTLFITSLNHGHWSVLHLFTGWTLLILPLAVVWARRHDVARHRRAMMGLFYGGFAINLVVAFIPGRTLWTAFFG